MRYRHAKGLLSRNVAGELMLMAVGEGAPAGAATGFFVLNGTGEVLWNALSTPKTEDELARLLIETYEVSFEQAVADVRAFVNDGTAQGILEHDEG